MQKVTIENYKELSAWYDSQYARNGFWASSEKQMEDQFNLLSRFAGDLQGLALFDIGCGRGDQMRYADRLGFNVVDGCDISSFAIAEANKIKDSKDEIHYALMTYYCEPFESLSLPMESYDVVTSFGSIEHCINLHAAFTNAHKILKKDGIALFYVPNDEWLHDDQPNERALPDEDWRRVINLADFGILHEERSGNCTTFICQKI